MDNLSSASVSGVSSTYQQDFQNPATVGHMNPPPPRPLPSKPDQPFPPPQLPFKEKLIPATEKAIPDIPKQRWQKNLKKRPKRRRLPGGRVVGPRRSPRRGRRPPRRRSPRGRGRGRRSKSRSSRVSSRRSQRR